MVCKDVFKSLLLPCFIYRNKWGGDCDVCNKVLKLESVVAVFGDLTLKSGIASVIQFTASAILAKRNNVPVHIYSRVHPQCSILHLFIGL